MNLCRLCRHFHRLAGKFSPASSSASKFIERQKNYYDCYEIREMTTNGMFFGFYVIYCINSVQFVVGMYGLNGRI